MGDGSGSEDRQPIKININTHPYTPQIRTQAPPYLPRLEEEAQPEVVHARVVGHAGQVLRPLNEFVSGCVGVCVHGGWGSVD